MSYETEGQLIRDHVAATWSLTPYERPNADFDPPQEDPWARLTILPLPAERLCVGQGPVRRRFPSLAVFQIFVRSATGDEVPLQLVDAATAMFREPGIPGLTFFEPGVQREGLDEFGWVGWTISARFQRDELI